MNNEKKIDKSGGLLYKARNESGIPTHEFRRYELKIFKK